MVGVLAPRSVVLTALESGVCLLLNVVSIVGNSLVLVLMHKSARLRTITNRYITAIAIIDLLSATILMPMTGATLMTGQWLFGDLGCGVHAFFMHFCLYASACTLALTAVNRYVKIVKPVKYRAIFTEKRSTIYLACAWGLVTAYVIVPNLAGWAHFRFHPGHVVCLSAFKPGSDAYAAHYTIVIGGFVVVPLVLASVCYYKISQTIKSHNAATAASLQNRPNSISVHEIQISRSLFVVVFFFIVSWVPTWIVVALYRYKLVVPIPRNATLLCTFLFFSSNCINPFIYAGMNGTFRQEMKRLLACGLAAQVWPDSADGNEARGQARPTQSTTANSAGEAAQPVT